MLEDVRIETFNERERVRGVPLLGKIPIEPAVAQGGDDGKPVALQLSHIDASAAPPSPAARAFGELARLVATRRPGMLRVGWGLERNRNGGAGIRAALARWVLAGQFGRPGAGVLSSTSGGDLADPDGTADQDGSNTTCSAGRGTFEAMTCPLAPGIGSSPGANTSRTTTSSAKPKASPNSCENSAVR